MPVPTSNESTVHALHCSLRVKPRPGALGHDHAALAGLEALVEERVEPLEVLDPGLARVGRREVEVDLHREVGCELETRVVGERGEPQEGVMPPTRGASGWMMSAARASMRRTCSATLESISPVAMGVSRAAARWAWPSAS